MTAADRSASILACLACLACVLACAACEDGEHSAEDAGTPGVTNADAGAGADAADDVDASDVDASGGAPTLRLFGAFVVSFIADEPAHATTFGSLFDGPSPPTMPLELATELGECRLLVPASPFCEDGCDGTSTCTADDVCSPFPMAREVGPVRVLGLGDGEQTLAPFGTSRAYQTAETLPHPPCAEGDDVQVQSAAFDIEAQCMAPLELSGADAILVRADEPIPLTWTPGSQAVGAQIAIKLDLSHHGGKKGQIECVVADTGSFDIPAALVTELVGLGLAGYPTITLARKVSAVSEAQPDVRLELSSAITRAVDTGVASCMLDDDCAQGMTCAADAVCR